MKSHAKHVNKTGKFLAYVLGRRPDEFGLIPNAHGFVPVKELLKAIHEESGWKHVREAHMNEVVTAVHPPPIEIEGKQVRATDQTVLPVSKPAQNLPKLLYIAIRKRAYARVAEQGLAIARPARLILSSDKAMALRLGRRKDNAPVLLSVQVNKTQNEGVSYEQYGESLYLTDFIPAGTFSGPALPKQRPIQPKAVATDKPEDTPVQNTAGSYYVDLNAQLDQKANARQRRLKEKERQRARRHARKHKTDRHG